MALEQRIHLKQQQKLVMSPRMLQSLNILRMPLLELKGHLEQEILSNPVIEEASAGEDYEQSSAEGGQEGPEAGEEWEDYYKSLSHQEYMDGEEGKESYLDSLAGAYPDLREYLTSQLHISGCENIPLGEYIIGNIDDNGYLGMRAGEIAAAGGEPVESVERVIALIQTFDPPGAGARSLGESLLLQASAAKSKNPLAERIIRDYLPELQKKQLNSIAAGLNAGMEEVINAVKFISGLNPHPGAAFSKGAAPIVSPDVTIRKEGKEYSISVNDAGLPRLGISKFYRNLLNKGASGETRRFIEKKIKSAEWLVNAVANRKNSLEKVSEYIFNAQRKFFEGAGGISPMRMKDAAGETGLSESTVSRAVSGKYIETDSGIYTMKHFFSGRIESNADNETSSASVKGRIAGIIKHEPPLKPLSDAEITGILKGEGINISRRTVAKYREAEGLLPAALRKKFS